MKLDNPLTHHPPEQSNASFATEQVPGPPAAFVWGREEALDRLGGDEDLLKELCQIFLKECPGLMQKLRNAISENNADGVQRAAHSIKGEVSYLGAPSATEAAKRLEDMGHNNDLSQAMKTFVALERELKNLQLAVQKTTGAHE